MKQLVVIGGKREQFKTACREMGRKPKQSVHCQRIMDLRHLDLSHSKVVTVTWTGASTLDRLELESMLNHLHFNGEKWSHIR